MSTLSLTQLVERHAGPLSDKASNLSELDRVLAPYRDLPVRLLQIGVQNGSLLQAWTEYFASAQKLVGCDIDPERSTLSGTDPRLALLTGDPTCPETRARIREASPQYDIIIDAGPHESGAVVKAFAHYFPLLREGGVYIAAGLEHSHDQGLQGGSSSLFSAVSFFKSLADLAGFEQWGMQAAPMDALAGFEAHYGFQVDGESLLHIHSVTFSHSMCAVARGCPPQASPESRANLGQHAQDVTAPALPDPERQALAERLSEVQHRLEKANAELDIIFHSRAWRLTSIVWQLRSLLRRGKDAAAVRTKISVKLLELWKALKAVPVQDRLIRKLYSPDTRKLVVFLVPGYDVVNGGIMSIVSIARVSAELKAEHGAEVIVMTMPRHFLLTRYSRFANNTNIFRFPQLVSYFRNLEELTIHIPEYHVVEFPRFLTGEQADFLKKVPHLHLNILIQNIWLAPSRDDIDQLRRLTGDITGTTAHSKYCTPEIQQRFGIPLHHLSVDIGAKYYYKPYEEKEDLVVVSHDESPHRDAILQALGSGNPQLQFTVVQHMTFEEYKRLISRAKWVITFGEGQDGYFIEGIRSGCIPFAVYNPSFFSDHFRGLPNLYASYEALTRDLPADLRKLDEPRLFRDLSQLLIERDKLEYNPETYRENVRKFYRKEYKLP